MTGFIYHIPKYSGTADYAAIKIRYPELAEQFGQISFDSRKVTGGPSGENGMIFSMMGRLKGTADVGLRYQPKDQTWQKTKEGYWVGYWNEHKPEPEDLQRATIQAGYKINLADGNDWIIPIIRQVETQGSALPEVMTMDGEGEIIFQPLEKYVEVTQMADRVWRQALIDNGIDMNEDGEIAEEGESVSVVGDFEPMSTRDRWKFVITGFAMNYFVGQTEIAMLKIVTFNPGLDQGNINSICTAMIDINSVIGVLAAFAAGAKKNVKDASTPLGSVTSNGDGD